MFVNILKLMIKMWEEKKSKEKDYDSIFVDYCGSIEKL